ncbi:MAG: glutamyl-tRNA reductase [Anaerolineales bacterium]|nr:glutamyl-tRNA reductase [Anaerolineales bacterium]
MHIFCLGVNHTTASLALREKLSFDEESAHAALTRLSRGEGFPQPHEMVIVSTCNRIELYAAAVEPNFDALETFLAEARGVAVEAFRDHVYRYVDEKAVSHLFRVASGLDSMVLGEPQILGQITHSLELALDAGVCGTLLSRLFRSAIHAGKRARTETAISRNPASVPSLAAWLAAREVKNISLAQVVVVGAGEMAELAVEALRKRGASQITVVNRTLTRAQSLAARWQAKAATFEQLEELLLEAEVVITSTSAPHVILHASQMRRIMSKRHRPSITMIDIAAPRDVEPAVGKVPGVKLYDLDQLQHQVQHLLAERAAAAPQVEAILAEEKAQFLQYFNSLNMLPLITELRQQADAIRQYELERTLRRLPDLTQVERERIEAMTHALVNKLLEAPTLRLRMEANCPHASEYATAVRTLFDLPGESGVCAFSKQFCSLQGSDENMHLQPLIESANRGYSSGNS